jgi:acyl-ACP thioesterase
MGHKITFSGVYMNPAPSEWKDRHKVNVYESDNLKRAGMITLFNYFQNAAWAHYNEVEKARGPFLTPSQIWAMTRVEVVLNRTAMWQDDVTVETWSRGIEKLMAYRDFIIWDKDGERIGAGTASWVVIDLVSKRIQRLSDISSRWPSKPDVFSIGKNAEKVASPDNPVYGEVFTVKYSDMDLNQHVNSARYIQWMLDSFGREFLENHDAIKCEVNYIDEVMPGEEVFTGKQEISNNTYVYLANVTRKNDNKEVCRLRVEFRERKQDDKPL